MKTQRVCLNLPDELLKQLDKAAAANYSTQSQYLRECIVLRLRGSKALKREQDEFLEGLRKLSETD